MLISPAALSKNKAKFYRTNRFSFFFFKSAVFRVRVFTVPARERRVIAAYANESVGVENDLRLGRSATLVAFFFFFMLASFCGQCCASQATPRTMWSLFCETRLLLPMVVPLLLLLATMTAEVLYTCLLFLLHSLAVEVPYHSRGIRQGVYCIVISLRLQQGLGSEKQNNDSNFFLRIFFQRACLLTVFTSFPWPPSPVLPPLYFCTLFMENIDTEA